MKMMMMMMIKVTIFIIIIMIIYIFVTGKYTFRNRPKGPRSAIAAAVLPRAGSLLKSIKRVADAKTGE